MEAQSLQRDQRSTKNVKKGALETGSGKDTKKVPKRRGWDPQKQCFRIEGVAKIPNPRGLRKVTKMTPKLLLKWSQIDQKAVPEASRKTHQQK